MDTKLAYDWLTFWVNANHPSFKECTIDESEDIQTKMKNVTNEIVQEAITTENPDIDSPGRLELITSVNWA